MVNSGIAFPDKLVHVGGGCNRGITWKFGTDTSTPLSVTVLFVCGAEMKRG